MHTFFIFLLIYESKKLISQFKSIFISVPITLWAANSWLEEFSYRIDISPLSFAVSGVITLLLVLITISIQSFKTALENPVKALRTE